MIFTFEHFFQVKIGWDSVDNECSPLIGQNVRDVSINIAMCASTSNCEQQTKN